MGSREDFFYNLAAGLIMFVKIGGGILILWGMFNMQESLQPLASVIIGCSFMIFSSLSTIGLIMAMSKHHNNKKQK